MPDVFKPMKILIASDQFPPEQWGGASSVATLHAKELVRRGLNVRIFTITQSKSDIGFGSFDGMDVFRAYSKYHERWRAWRSVNNTSVVNEFKDILDDMRPDIVHFHNVHHHISYASIKSAKTRSSKVFLTLHDVMSFNYGKLCEKSFIRPEDTSVRNVFDYKISALDNIRRSKKRYNPFRNIAIKKYLGFADKLIAVSRALKDAVEQNGISNVEVVRNGIDAENWVIDESEVTNLKQQLDIRERPTILFVGRLTGTKGGDVILKALDMIIKKVPKAVLLIVGDDGRAYKNDFQGNIDYVRFVPSVAYSEIKKYYHCSDVVVVPSLCFDSFPTVNLEAMACAKPVVATHFGGSPEAVEHEKTGYVVNPLNIENLSNCVIDLLSDTEKAKRFGEAGRKRVLGELNVASHIDSLYNLYTSV